MALSKVRETPSQVQFVATPREKEYREQLVDIYRAKIAEKESSDMDIRTLVEVITDSIALSHHLLELGQEREANQIRKAAVKRLLTKAEQSEGEIFGLKDDIVALQEKMLPIQEKLVKHSEKQQELVDTNMRLVADYQALSESEREAQKPAFEAASAKAEKEYNGFVEKNVNPLLKELEPLNKELQASSQKAQVLAQQALYLKASAINIMVELENSAEALGLATSTLSKYYANGIFGGAEGLVASALNANAKHVQEQVSRRDLHDMHRLHELGVESAIEAADTVENAVKNSGAPEDLLNFAVQFRQIGATISASSGNTGDVEALLVAKSTEYVAEGHSALADKMLIAASEIYHQAGHQLINVHNATEARKVIDKSIELKLGVVERLESEVLLKPPVVVDQQQAQMDALMAQLTGQTQGNRGPTIDDAVKLRQDVVHLYVLNDKYKEALDMLTEVA